MSGLYEAILRILGCGNEPSNVPSESAICPPGSLPPLSSLSPDEAVPRGIEKHIAGLDVYVTGDVTSSRIVVVAHDIWGFRAGRHRQVCDVIASRLGCAVYLPDLFAGSPATQEVAPSNGPAFSAWVGQWTDADVTAKLDRLLTGVFAQARKSVGFVGFCWGSFAGTLAAAGGRVRAVAHVHPSHRKLLEKVHSYSAEASDALVGRAKAATCMLTAGNDDPRCKPGGADERLLKAAGVPVRLLEFPEMAHGWVIKGDTDDPATARDVQAAVGVLVRFLDEHLPC